jgi:TolA-binding protein
MMTNKDCKDLEETVRKINPKGPNDLEEQIRVLQFRNEKLHLHNQKIEQQIIELRKDNKVLAKQVEDQIKQFRNKGAM